MRKSKNEERGGVPIKRAWVLSGVIVLLIKWGKTLCKPPQLASLIHSFIFNITSLAVLLICKIIMYTTIRLSCPLDWRKWSKSEMWDLVNLKEKLPTSLPVGRLWVCLLGSRGPFLSSSMWQQAQQDSPVYMWDLEGSWERVFLRGENGGSGASWKKFDGKSSSEYKITSVLQGSLQYMLRMEEGCKKEWGGKKTRKVIWLCSLRGSVAWSLV